MLNFVAKRLLSGFITVWFIATATFFAMHAVPGDPLLNSKNLNPEIHQNLLRQYGLDKPLATQYLLFLKNMLHGDFGISFVEKNRKVNDIILEHFPVSAVLGLVAILIATIGGILWGALTAIYRDRMADAVIMFMVILAVSIPSFVLAAGGQLLILSLKSRLGWSVLPIAGWGSLSHRIMPALVPGLRATAEAQGNRRPPPRGRTPATGTAAETGVPPASRLSLHGAVLYRTRVQNGAYAAGTAR